MKGIKEFQREGAELMKQQCEERLRAALMIGNDEKTGTASLTKHAEDTIDYIQEVLDDWKGVLQYWQGFQNEREPENKRPRVQQ